MTGYVTQTLDKDLFAASFGVKTQNDDTESICYLIWIMAFLVQSTHVKVLSEVVSLDAPNSPDNFG